jgi:uncharacterized protein YPO0396
MLNRCQIRVQNASEDMNSATRKASMELAKYKDKCREQQSLQPEHWTVEHTWLSSYLDRLRKTELVDYEEQMQMAYKASQETFKMDVAIELHNKIETMRNLLMRLNKALSSSPSFSNGERYSFIWHVRPQTQALYDFVQSVAANGTHDEDLFGGTGPIPEEFHRLLEDKVNPAAGSINPLDDYREFFAFDVKIINETSRVEGAGGKSGPNLLSKRVGTGSGGEHRAPLYVIAGAALASAYRMENGNKDGVRLILLDEAFNKMDIHNIVSTMRYFEELGMQVLMASPGENQGILNAFMHRYYDMVRDPESDALEIQGHDLTEKTRDTFRSDLPQFEESLLKMEMEAVR